MRVSHVDDLSRNLMLTLPSLGRHARLGPLENKPWYVEFYIVDPSGNLIRIGQEIYKDK